MNVDFSPFEDVTYKLESDMQKELLENNEALKEVKPGSEREFRKYMKKNFPENHYFYFEGPLMLHQPSRYQFVVQKKFEDDIVNIECITNGLEPFYISTLDESQFIPTLFDEQSFLNFLENLINQGQVTQEISTDYKKKELSLDKLLITNVVGHIQKGIIDDRGLYVVSTLRKYGNTPIDLKPYVQRDLTKISH